MAESPLSRWTNHGPIPLGHTPADCEENGCFHPSHRVDGGYCLGCGGCGDPECCGPCDCVFEDVYEDGTPYARDGRV